MSEPTIVEFDLDRYLRNSKKVDLGGIEWAEIPDHPLSDGDVMCLHYMMDIETHTVIYLRDLLATRVAADPQITAFLELLGLRGALARGGVLGLPALLRHRGAGRAEAPGRLDPDAHPPQPLARAAGQDRRRQRAGDRADDAGLDDDPRLRRHPHDVGSRQRADDADRLPRPDPPLRPPGAPPAPAKGDPGRAPPLRLLSRPGEGTPATRPHGPPARPLGAVKTSGRRWERGSRARRRSTRWRIYLFGDSPEGREQIREIDHTISDVPGLGGMTIARGLPRCGPAPGGRAAGLGGHRPAASGAQAATATFRPPRTGRRPGRARTERQRPYGEGSAATAARMSVLPNVSGQSSAGAGGAPAVPLDGVLPEGVHLVADPGIASVVEDRDRAAIGRVNRVVVANELVDERVGA